ncbi:MAG: WD40 repeat domain-containing protein, partial [Candidatus Eisenbacteria bacterium]|nr:WD40 repeat domain-containing protein [Candidatus Eisenbacteria bacterium]
SSAASDVYKRQCLASSSLSSSGIEIWDLQTGRIARVLDPGGIPYALAFSPDGEQLAAGCSDFQARVFRLGSGTAPVPSLPPRNLEPPRRDAEPILLTGHQSAIVDVGFVGDRVLCTAGWDATVRFWDLSSASELLDPLYGRSLAGIADRIALQDASGTLAVYSFSPGYGMRVLRSPVESGVVGHASFLPDGRHLVSASVRGGVRLWNLTTGNSAVLSDEPSRSAVLLPDHGLLVALSPRGLLAWKHDLSRAQDLVLAAPSLLWRGEEAMDVDRGPDGSVLSVVERGGRVILLDTGATPGAVLRSYPGFGGLVTSCMSADGRWLFLGSWKGGESRLLDAQTGDAILTFPGPHVRGLFAPDGRHLLVTSAVEARLLDLGTWQEAARFALTPQTSDLAGLAAFRPDGHVLALTPNRFQVELVSVPDGHTLATLPNPSYAAILDLAFSDDARLLAAMTPGREILVWDLEGMQAALEPLGLAWDE